MITTPLTRVALIIRHCSLDRRLPRHTRLFDAATLRAYAHVLSFAAVTSTPRPVAFIGRLIATPRCQLRFANTIRLLRYEARTCVVTQRYAAKMTDEKRDIGDGVSAADSSRQIGERAATR